MSEAAHPLHTGLVVMGVTLITLAAVLFGVNATCRKSILTQSLITWRMQARRQLALFHRRTRTASLYKGCLAWYNVVLTTQIQSIVKYSQQSQQPTRATVE